VSRILIVEDEPAIALALEDDLRLEGHEVEVVADGDAASRAAREGEFDAILLDVMLPKKDGFEVCREIRRAGVRTPILMLTAKTQEAEKVMGLDLGADDYLTKPYSRHELRARVRALLRRAAAEAPDVYRFADVEVDFGRAEVRRGGERVDLTPLEFKLMATFARSRGRVFTRQQLLDAAWGRDLAVTERVVDNQILNLRRKVESDPAHPRFIAGVRGIGYRFDG
jgi:two-component system alkaline phosphatase synthesis response regulator PhoP